MAYAPPVTLHNYTNTHATHSNVPWSWTGLVPQCLVGLSASPRRCRWAAWAGWVGSSCPPPLRGWGRTAPPLGGGAAYLRGPLWRARGRPPACCARALASAAVSALVIALSKTGVRVVLPVSVMEARMPNFFLVSSGTCSVRPRILSRNLEFDPFSKSHSWAGYICFVLSREYSSISVTHGDSCNR